jgi:hypothetical protein
MEHEVAVQRLRRIFPSFVAANLAIFAVTIWICLAAKAEWIAFYGAALQLIAIWILLAGLRGTLQCVRAWTAQVGYSVLAGRR